MRNKKQAFIIWYNQRNTRERLFVLLLTYALMWAILHFTLFNPLDIERKKTKLAIKNNHAKKEELINQIAALNKLSKSKLYSDWMAHQRAIRGMKSRYQSLLDSFSAQAWQRMIQTIINETPNIQLIKLQMLPEERYQINITGNKEHDIYEQRIAIIIMGQYFETLNYLTELKQVLPHIYWRKFDYDVIQYPLANIKMELSIFYEKRPV